MSDNRLNHNVFKHQVYLEKIIIFTFVLRVLKGNFMSSPLVSLCMPTNGIIEWVFPALDSIYSQGVDNNLFEVVVTNNGSNEEFDSRMTAYAKLHSNLRYKKTDAYMFFNQLEALKLAKGTYLKFVNHRSIFHVGALEKIISIISCNIESKPVIYFSNGTLKNNSYSLGSFDDFIAILGKYVSWTTGVGIWKEQYEKIPKDAHIDKISPHSCILFADRQNSKYLVENFVFAQDIVSDHSKKGNYDLFKAFAVEEPTIALNLLIDGDISYSTFKKIKNDYGSMLSELYWTFIVRKKSCSYDLSNFDNAMGIFFNKYKIVFNAYTYGIVSLLKGRFKKLLIGK